MIKIGLLGVGHLGKIHLKLLNEIEAFELVGFFDPDLELAKKVSEDKGIPYFTSEEELLAKVDAVDIVAPTLAHHSCAIRALQQGKHIFIEKPLTNTLEEAKELLQFSEQHPNLKIQVGHVERFNPAFLSVSERDLNPMFIEGHRLALYNPRGTDVSVVLDLMIHDLDIVLSVVKSPVRKVSASGVAVISESPDIANARIEFENGCVANLTASRISVKNLRRLRFFQKDTYLAVDFLEKKSEIFKLSQSLDEVPEGVHPIKMDSGQDTRYLYFEQPEIHPVNAIRMELEEFAGAIAKDAAIRVSLEDGYRNLSLAHQILQEIEDLAGRVQIP
ncbi:MAG: Gfo/Idh/MocA family oxidoreductase [Bacteroidota bacterium]